MTKVENGDFVAVVYEGMLDNGEIFESSSDTGPLEFQIGDNSVLPGFEQAISGMEIDENKTIRLPPDEAYGPRQEDLVHTIARQTLSKDIVPSPGMILGMTIERQGQKHKIPAMVTEMEGDTITIDFNHPLAGQALTYKITLKKITKANQAGSSQTS